MTIRKWLGTIIAACFLAAPIVIANAQTSVTIDEVNFPDANFRACVTVYDTNGDGVLSEDEIELVKTLFVSSKKISDLTGIEYFTALMGLYCFENQLTVLDLSNNAALSVLHCEDNQLTTIDLSNNAELRVLCCENNQLTTLDLSHKPALKDLGCTNNQLTTLNVSQNTALDWLSCGNNQLTRLDVSCNTAVTELICGDNQLAMLDVSNNAALTFLDCHGNQIMTLDMSHNIALESLYCYDNQLSSIDVSQNASLWMMYCDHNQLTKLDLSQNTNLTELQCEYNQLTVLALGNNSALTYMTCESNQLTTLDVSQCPNLVDCIKENEYNEDMDDDGVSYACYSSEDGWIKFDIGVNLISVPQPQFILTLPAGLTEIGAEAFRGTAVEAVVAPAGLKTIGALAFAYCDTLEEVHLPGSVTNIADNAFAGSNHVIIVTASETIQAWATAHGVAWRAPD